MHIRIGIENNNENRCVAWALDYPGCFSYGLDEAEALLNLPRALIDFETWVDDHTPNSWLNFSDIDLKVVDRYTTSCIGADYRPAQPGEGYEINAWFADDWRPLSSDEINTALTIFGWQRDELLAGLSTLDPHLLDQTYPGERWNILGIASHIANAELWLLSRLSLTTLTHKDLEYETKSRLAQTAKMIRENFENFADQVNVVGIEGEFWSFRKVVRRTLWHQRDHIEHIKSLAFQ